MAYTVDKFDGTFLTSVPDGTIDSTTDIRFVGKNYAGYGEIQNENFLHIMENFANTTPPPKPVVGQIWYDSNPTVKKLKFYDGTIWKTTTGAVSSTTSPTGLMPGDFWWDSNSKQLYTYSGTEYVLIGPQVPPDLGASAVVARVVKDINDVPHTIVEIKSAGVTVVTVSEDEEFQLKTSENPITGFNPPNKIKRGITLANTNTLGITTDSHVFWGSASNALRLGGYPASDFINLLQGNFSQSVRFGDDGYILGARGNLHVKVENTDQLIFENKLGENFIFKIAPNEILEIAPTGIIPSNDNTVSLGSVGDRWANVYALNVTATNLTGTLTGNSNGIHKGNLITSTSRLLVDHVNNIIGTPETTNKTTFRGIFDGEFIGSTFSGTAENSLKLGGFSYNVDPIPNTVPIRDENGNLYASNFVVTGSVNKADTLLFDGDYRSASATLPAPTDKRSIVARTSEGDIYASLFRGTATAARYADLAEKYLADREYEVGTVMMIGGVKEVTASSENKRAIGVISANPAFMMNSELNEGVYVALKGRVPVKVTGPVNKGDELIASDYGYAKVADETSNKVFAIALESSSEYEVKLVEAIIL